MNVKTKGRTKNMVLCALFAALMAVLSQIVVPIGAIPFNLGVLGAFLAGMLLNVFWASASIIVYMLLALVGMPVLAGMQGGPGALFGPTGGFVIGYLAIAFLTSLAINKSNKIHMHIFSMAIGLIICYFLGTVYFMFLTQNNLITSLTYCVIPFIIPDIIKLVCAYVLGKNLRKHLMAQNLI